MIGTRFEQIQFILSFLLSPSRLAPLLEAAQLPPDRGDHRVLVLVHLRVPGCQLNSFVEISTDFSTDFLTEFPVLQGVPHQYKNSVEKSVELSPKLLN